MTDEKEKQNKNARAQSELAKNQTDFYKPEESFGAKSTLKPVKTSSEATNEDGDQNIAGTSKSVKLVSKKSDEKNAELTDLSKEKSSLDKS